MKALNYLKAFDLISCLGLKPIDSSSDTIDNTTVLNLEALQLFHQYLQRIASLTEVSSSSIKKLINNTPRYRTYFDLSIIWVLGMYESQTPEILAHCYESLKNYVQNPEFIQIPRTIAIIEDELLIQPSKLVTSQMLIDIWAQESGNPEIKNLSLFPEEPPISSILTGSSYESYGLSNQSLGR